MVGAGHGGCVVVDVVVVGVGVGVAAAGRGMVQGTAHGAVVEIAGHAVERLQGSSLRVGRVGAAAGIGVGAAGGVVGLLGADAGKAVLLLGREGAEEGVARGEEGRGPAGSRVWGGGEADARDRGGLLEAVTVSVVGGWHGAAVCRGGRYRCGSVSVPRV